VFRTGRSRSVALHPVSPRRSYGSIPHGFFLPHRSGLPPPYPLAFSGARARIVPIRSGPKGASAASWGQLALRFMQATLVLVSNCAQLYGVLKCELY